MTMTDEQLDKPFSLLEINLAAMSLAALAATLSLDLALAELARLQRSRATFWLTASSHVREGKKLSGFLSTYWPAMYATPVAIAEHAGKLPQVLEGLAQTAELQLEIRNLMRKLLYPIAMIIAGVGVNLFMLLTVIPALTFGDGYRKPSAMMQLSKSVHEFLTGNSVALVVGLCLAGVAVFRFARRPDVTSSILSKLDEIPTLASAVRALYFGLWARYISLMQDCGIPLQDALRLSEPLLLPYMVPSIAAVHENARMGYRHALDLDRIDESDPRQRLPVLVCNAFRLTESTGNGSRHFEHAAKPLIKLGMDQIKRFLTYGNNVASIAAAVIAVSPMGLYFTQMSDLISNAIR
jgi:type II secretory pathway component PulF